MREIMYWQAINEALAEEMERDETVFILGENCQAGTFMVTQGLVQRFGPDRVMDSPLSENAITGATVGAATAGYRPVCDLMFADFIYCAADEILLKAAQHYFAQGGKVNAPCVFMGIAGGGFRVGPEHSHIPSAMILNNPGLKLALPVTPYDAKGLMKTAIRDSNPVVYFYHKKLMVTTGHVPQEEYTIPFGKADIKREGDDITVVATSYMCKLALDVAKEFEGRFSVEVIDPMTLEPLDIETILASVEKTGRVIVVDEDTERCGVGAEIGMQIVERGFDYLDAPIKRICAANMPIAGGLLEEYVIPQSRQIATAIEELMS
jgi:pyruvate/2-oxoglutarate/acetoin dehydrogenase E1 component